MNLDTPLLKTVIAYEIAKEKNTPSSQGWLTRGSSNINIYGGKHPADVAKHRRQIQSEHRRHGDRPFFS